MFKDNSKYRSNLTHQTSGPKNWDPLLRKFPLYLSRTSQAIILLALSINPVSALGLTALTNEVEDLGPQKARKEHRDFYASGKKLSKNKNFKKKTKNSRVDDFGPMDVAPVGRGNSDIGIGVHREQEGVDRPYSLEIATSSGSVISFLKGSRDTAKTSVTSVETFVELTMILGQIQLGLEIDYLSKEESIAPSSTKEEQSKKNAEVKLGGGPVAKLNFGNIDTQLTVPFVYAGGSYVIDEFKFSDSENISYSGHVIRGGLGLHLFLDSNISFAPKLEFFSENLHATNNKDKTSKGPRGLIQLALFL